MPEQTRSRATTRRAAPAAAPGSGAPTPPGDAALPGRLPGMLRDDEPVLEMDEIQGNGLVGFNKDYQTYLFLEMEKDATGVEAMREWIRGIAPRVSSAADVFAFNQLFRSMRRKHGQDPRGLIATWVNVAFSYAAVAALTSPDEADDFTDELFRVGMAANAADLGDPDDETAEGHPSRWVVGGPGNEADVVIAVASDDPDILSDEVRRIEDGLYNGVTASGIRLSCALRVIYKQHGATLPGALTGREHFGFKDGVSQPGIRGTATHPGEPITPRWVDPADPVQQNPRYPEFARPGQPLIWPGEFVFGYPRQNRNDRREPGPLASTCPRWARNGSYVVVRRLRQDVEGFRAWVRDAAAGLAQKPAFAGLTPGRLAALVVGRWPSGAPLLRAPLADEPALGRDSFIANHFTYRDDVPPLKLLPQARNREVPGAPGDPQGLVCPFAGHIRKVNPRDVDTEQGSSSDTLTRMVMRRGIPFGTPLDETVSAEDDPLRGDRGLLFVCYQTSILEQFRFLQQQWANDATFPGGGGGPDPVIGQRNDDGARVRHVDLPGSDGSMETVSLPADFVIPTGGGYFFAPSLGALRYVLGGTPEEKARYLASLPEPVEVPEP